MNPPQRPKSPATVRVCLIEDDPMDVRLISEMLTEAGRGQFALNGIHRCLGEAILSLQGDDGSDLILLDLSLPDSQGIETFRRLAEAIPHLPVIVLSGYDDEALAVQTVHEGAQDYLVKNDLVPRLLVREIHYAIERKRTELELQTARDKLEQHVEERTRELKEANVQLEDALRRWSEAQAQMIQQERLHALERMASGIANDFNNALSPILAHSEWLLLKHQTLSEEKLGETLLKIYNSTEHCVEIVNRLREFYRSRDEMGQFAPLDMRVILKDAILLTQPSWKDQAQARGIGIKVETTFDSALPNVLGAKSELREMLTNLMLNSVDALTRNGVIRVSAFLENERVCVRIGDTGIGMTEEIGIRCMEPFFTTKHGVGSGLGLGVVYGIAQRHEAEINIDSEVGVGTDVTVRFPIYNPLHSPYEVVVPIQGLRILVADDEPMIREVLAVYLSEDSHEVEMAADGAEALSKLRGGRFDLIITDHSMPEISGYRLAEEARELDPEVRILLLTGFSDSGGNKEAHAQASLDAMIPKPFTFESVRRGICKAMENTAITADSDFFSI